VPKATKKRLELEQAVAELRAADPVLGELIDQPRWNGSPSPGARIGH
jgi:hypothetical protein